MTTISITDFALHIQAYLDQALQGEAIRVHLQNGRYIALVPELTQPAVKKKYNKSDLFKLLAYQGGLTDSQEIDQIIYA